VQLLSTATANKTYAIIEFTCSGVDIPDVAEIWQLLRQDTLMAVAVAISF
jgi:hypothetical protein